MGRFRSLPSSDGDVNEMKSPTDDGDNVPSSEGEGGLKRQVGLFSAVFLIVGTMIGSGIFISPKGVLFRSGSVATSLLVWTGCGCVSLMDILFFRNYRKFL